MTKLTQTVRRTADISRADALKGLVAKFPDYDIDSMRLEIVEHKTASGEVTSTSKQWVAEIHKSGFEELPVTDDPAQEDSDDPTPEKDEGPEVEVTVEDDGEGEEKPESTEDMLHELLSLVKEMVGDPAGEGAPHGEEGPERLPGAVPGDPGLSELPAAVKPTNSMENMQQGPRPAFAHMAHRRHFVVQATAPGQTLKAAVLELNAALAPTHRVARIKRDGADIIAGVTRIPNGV